MSLVREFAVRLIVLGVSAFLTACAPPNFIASMLDENKRMAEQGMDAANEGYRLRGKNDAEAKVAFRKAYQLLTEQRKYGADGHRAEYMIEIAHLERKDGNCIAAATSLRQAIFLILTSPSTDIEKSPQERLNTANKWVLDLGNDGEYCKGSSEGIVRAAGLEEIRLRGGSAALASESAAQAQERNRIRSEESASQRAANMAMLQSTIASVAATQQQQRAQRQGTTAATPTQRASAAQVPVDRGQHAVEDAATPTPRASSAQVGVTTGSNNKVWWGLNTSCANYAPTKREQFMQWFSFTNRCSGAIKVYYGTKNRFNSLMQLDPGQTDKSWFSITVDPQGIRFFACSAKAPGGEEVYFDYESKNCFYRSGRR